MILSFSTKWPDRMGELVGQPNYFVEKILLGIFRYYPISFVELRNSYNQMADRELTSFLEIVQLEKEGFAKKIHTIRSGNRWRAGMDIHFVINNRTKDRFQFAPVIKCVSVQEIKIKYNPINPVYPNVNVFIADSDSIKLLSISNIRKLALNDGFDSAEAFFQYFNEDFKGKIIHWTDFKY